MGKKTRGKIHKSKHRTRGKIRRKFTKHHKIHRKKQTRKRLHRKKFFFGGANPDSVSAQNTNTNNNETYINQTTQNIKSALHIVDKLMRDPEVVNIVTNTANDVNKIIVKSIEDISPDLADAGSNVIQTIPIIGNILSAIRAGTKGIEGATKIAESAAKVGVLSLENAEKIKKLTDANHILLTTGTDVHNRVKALTAQAIQQSARTAGTVANTAIDTTSGVVRDVYSKE